MMKKKILPLSIIILHASITPLAIAQLECKESLRFQGSILAGKHKESHDLSFYSKALPFRMSENLKQTIQNLPKGSLWIDMAAEKSKTISEGLMLNPEVEGIALFSIQDPIKINRTILQLKGKVSLITDVSGPISYTTDLPQTIQSHMDLLKPQGEVLFNLLIRRNYRSGSQEVLIQDRMFLSNNVLNHDSPVQDGIVDWLRSIPGIEVTDVQTYSSHFHELREQSLAIRIRKVSDQVLVPRTLTTVSFQNSTPPIREFRLEFRKADQSRP